MGWSGHGIYDGDGTQTQHYNFIKWAEVGVSDNEIMKGRWLTTNRTKIPKKYLNKFEKGIPILLKKMPKIGKSWTEDSAMDWHMLLALFLDNKIKIHEKVFWNGISATSYLMGKVADRFSNPKQRRKNLANLISKAILRYKIENEEKFKE